MRCHSVGCGTPSRMRSATQSTTTSFTADQLTQIALGLLVDDAMITIESMVSKLEHGWDSIKAAIFAYAYTAYPSLTGNLACALGFVPVGFAKSSAGEYTFTLFAVVVIAVLTSWVV